MRISDWSSDVCSSDLNRKPRLVAQLLIQAFQQRASAGQHNALIDNVSRKLRRGIFQRDAYTLHDRTDGFGKRFCDLALIDGNFLGDAKSEEHTSELQSLMRISYAVFCLKKKNSHIIHINFAQHIQNQHLTYK